MLINNDKNLFEEQFPTSYSNLIENKTCNIIPSRFMAIFTKWVREQEREEKVKGFNENAKYPPRIFLI